MVIAAVLGLEDPSTDPMVVTAQVISVAPEGALCRLWHEGAGRPGPAVLPLTEYAADAWPRLVIGQRLHAVIIEPGSPPVLSVTRPDLITALLPGFVPEIRDGLVRVMRIAWKPGARAKVAVAACAPDVDPVAACLGRRANRVLALSQVLGGDKVEIVPWSENRERVLLNAMAPVRPTGVAISDRHAVVSVAAHQMSAAVGKGGLNSELAGRIAGLFVYVVQDGEDLQRALQEQLAEQQGSTTDAATPDSASAVSPDGTSAENE